MKLKIKKLHPAAVVPQYQTAGAACFDLHALSDRRYPVSPSDTLDIGTGLSVEVPQGHVMLIFSRSGHGFKNDVRLSNCVGVIDSDYRGEVRVKLRNDQSYDLSNPGAEAVHLSDLVVGPGDRIAQAMLVPIPRVEFEVVEELTNTERGTGGFGSTGVTCSPVQPGVIPPDYPIPRPA